ncbi:MAG TPA: tetratricopeptide repeat protein, partial [Mariniphaga sp.]|nr:tetratricopeptide repeat protein [Mariniphaga sp.]
MWKKTLLNLWLLISLSYSISANYITFYSDSLRAEDTYNSGIIFFKNNDYQQSIDSFLVSSQLRCKLYSENSYKYGVAQNALGITYKSLGDYNKSIDHFLQAEHAYQSDNKSNKASLSRLYNNIGNVYKSKLDFGTALDYFERSVALL